MSERFHQLRGEVSCTQILMPAPLKHQIASSCFCLRLAPSPPPPPQRKIEKKTGQTSHITDLSNVKATHDMATHHLDVGVASHHEKYRN